MVHLNHPFQNGKHFGTGWALIKKSRLNMTLNEHVYAIFGPTEVVLTSVQFQICRGFVKIFDLCQKRIDLATGSVIRRSFVPSLEWSAWDDYQEWFDIEQPNFKWTSRPTFSVGYIAASSRVQNVTEHRIKVHKTCPATIVVQFGHGLTLVTHGLQSRDSGISPNPWILAETGPKLTYNRI